MSLEKFHVSSVKTDISLQEPKAFIKRQDFFALLTTLSKSTSVSIRIKRIDRLNYGNFSTVVRASGALIMLRETNYGPAEVIPDLRDVQHFELDKDFSAYCARTIYGVI